MYCCNALWDSLEPYQVQTIQIRYANLIRCFARGLISNEHLCGPAIVDIIMSASINAMKSLCFSDYTMVIFFRKVNLPYKSVKILFSFDPSRLHCPMRFLSSFLPKYSVNITVLEFSSYVMPRCRPPLSFSICWKCNSSGLLASAA